MPFVTFADVPVVETAVSVSLSFVLFTDLIVLILLFKWYNLRTTCIKFTFCFFDIVVKNVFLQIAIKSVSITNTVHFQNKRTQYLLMCQCFKYNILYKDFFLVYRINLKFVRLFQGFY